MLSSGNRGRSRGGRPLIALRWVPVTSLAVIVVASLVLAWAAQATDHAAFCTTCHEMGPYYTAWSTGPHKGVQCVECHVAPGLASRLSHKTAALREVRAHFAGDTALPKGGVSVPNERCARCHAKVPDRLLGATSRFSHDAHERADACWRCHPETGHTVSSGAATAGVVPAKATPGTGMAGHVAIPCVRCHDAASMPCEQCHAPRHRERGACAKCHTPGPAWTFVHPGSSDCVSCHDRPANHRTGQCSTCHKLGRSWTFAHPSSRECGSCHARPAKHSAGACISCHTPGSKWAFTHPSGTSCASCHTAPAAHYGTTCASCHRPSVPFKQAKFTHPSTHHDYTSFSCTQCHPNTYAQASCTCHGGSAP